MRYSLFRIAIALAATAGLAALWIIPSSAQQVPGTIARPGMTDGRVWINNRTRDEAIPVNIVSVDPKGLPVSVQGTVPVSGAVGAARQSWEYRSVSVGADQDLAPALNGLGEQGWEAVGVTSQPGAKLAVLLKRPR